MKWKIPLFKIYSDDDDVDAVSKIIKRGTYWAIGPEIEEFESKIADYIGTKYAVAFNSGTSALHTLLLSYDVKGKEVIVPSFTFISTVNAVILAGGIPVFVESESETFGIDINDVKNKINEKTKVIIGLHYAGCPARDIIEIKDLAEKNNIILIEDAAESLGASINNKKVGTFGDSAMFSFCQNKIITTGEGGIIVTDNQEIYEKCKLIVSHGRLEKLDDYFSSTGDNDYIKVGYNYRMPSMLAALGLSQFQKIDKIISLRRQHAKYLNENLKGVTILKVPKNFISVYQMYTIMLKNKITRDSMQKYLAKNGIMTKVYFNPVHLKSIYTNMGYKKGDLPNTEKISDLVLTLPLYPDLKKEELDFMIKIINDFGGDLSEENI